VQDLCNLLIGRSKKESKNLAFLWKLLATKQKLLSRNALKLIRGIVIPFQLLYKMHIWNLKCREKETISEKHIQTGPFLLLCIYIYKRGPLYLCIYLCTIVPLSQANRQTNLPKFCTDLHTNSGKVLNTSMTPPTKPLWPQSTSNSNTWADHWRKNFV